MFKAIASYLRKSRAELGRVTWPSREEVLQATYATLAFVLVTSLFLLAVDGASNLIITRLLLGS